MSDHTNCPCCQYPTLTYRGMYEVCVLCDWEDDGQNELNQINIGGPNGETSLEEARKNFLDHLDMYPRDCLFNEYQSYRLRKNEKKRKLISQYQKEKLLIKGVENKSLLQESQKIKEELIQLTVSYIKCIENSYLLNKEAVHKIKSDNIKTVVDGLLNLTFSCLDWEYVEKFCFEYSKHNNPNIRGIAILCFGHLARIHGKLDYELVMSVVEKAIEDENDFVRGHANSALDDINMFIVNNG